MSMTLSLSIDAQTEARLRRMANDAGKDLTAYVAEIVQHAAAAQAIKGAHSPIDFEKALDDLFSGDARKLPPVPLTYSREDIYFDHD